MDENPLSPQSLTSLDNADPDTMSTSLRESSRPRTIYRSRQMLDSTQDAKFESLSRQIALLSLGPEAQASGSHVDRLPQRRMLPSGAVAGPSGRYGPDAGRDE